LLASVSGIQLRVELQVTLIDSSKLDTSGYDLSLHLLATIFAQSSLILFYTTFVDLRK